MSTWNVFDATGKVVGQLHGVPRDGYAKAVMFIKYHGDVSSKGITYVGEWPDGTFEVSEVGDKDRGAFARKKLDYFRQLDSKTAGKRRGSPRSRSKKKARARSHGR